MCCLNQGSSTPNNLIAIWVLLCSEQALLSHLKSCKLEYLFFYVVVVVVVFFFFAEGYWSRKCRHGNNT